MKNKVCKKCGKKLDANYKKDKCENCLIKKISKVKRIIRGIGVGTAGLCSIISFLRNKKGL